MFANLGLQASTDTVFNDQALPDSGTGAYNLYNPKVSFAGSSWSRGGRYFLNSSGTDILSLMPALSSDTFTVGYFQHSTFGSFGIYDNGSIVGSAINAAGSDLMVQVSKTRTASTNPWGVARTTGGSVGIQFLEAYHSTNTKVSLMNMSNYGATAETYTTGTTNVADRFYSMDTWLPDVAVICLGFNSWRSNEAVATWMTAMGSIIAHAQANGSDVILLGQPVENAPVYPAQQTAYISACYTMADTYGVPFVDINKRYGSYATMNGKGNYNGNIEQTAQGYSDMALALWDLVRPQ